MPAPAIFGIHNDGLNLAVNLLVLFLVVVWIALIAWTYLDARRRIRDGVLVACATGASLFPFVGTIIYTILRPPEFLEDTRERELEIRAAELRLRHLEEQSCPNCEHPIERSFLRCPNCRVRVKDPCESCGKPIDPRWTVCPYCETPVRRSAPPEEERRSRSSRTSRAPDAPAPKAKRSSRPAAAKDGTERPASRTGRPTRRTAKSSSRSSSEPRESGSSRPTRRSEPDESSSSRS